MYIPTIWRFRYSHSTRRVLKVESPKLYRIVNYYGFHSINHVIFIVRKYRSTSRSIKLWRTMKHLKMLKLDWYIHLKITEILKTVKICVSSILLQRVQIEFTHSLVRLYVDSIVSICSKISISTQRIIWKYQKYTIFQKFELHMIIAISISATKRLNAEIPKFQNSRKVPCT